MVERAQNIDLAPNSVCMRLLRSRSAGSGGSSQLLRAPFHGHANAGSARVVADGDVDLAVRALTYEIVVAEGVGPMRKNVVGDVGGGGAGHGRYYSCSMRVEVVVGRSGCGWGGGEA